MTTVAEVRQPSHGWKVVAGKELADYLLSARFIVLLVILGLAAAGAVYTAASGIRDVATQASGSPALFLRLFTISADPMPFSFFVFIGFLAPILGIAFGFDAVNGERAQGTLPRLVAQPIHRDDVINGKFVAGLSAIGLMLITLVLIVAGLGIFRLGIVPSVAEVARLVVWLIVAVLYVGFWLAFATWCSVMLRRASSSALVAIATWLVLALFAALLVQLIAGVIAPVPEGAGGDVILHNAQVEQTLSRISPITLYDEATTALLDPETRAVGIVTIQQLDRAIVSDLSLGQSLLLVWPQVVGLVALTEICFVAAYVTFMRQEIRA
ncbi:MAG: ABC transporter permease [Acidimicrobiia bacterium]|nr:ABC transporter permease [Acidimicrobiia bacterium]